MISLKEPALSCLKVLLFLSTPDLIRLIPDDYPRVPSEGQICFCE
jgi:hypothetical protein